MSRPSNRQSGFVLILGLILLVVLSFLSVSVMQTATLEERMAGNTLDRAKAFKGAEAALLDGWKEEAELSFHQGAYVYQGANLPGKAGRTTYESDGYLTNFTTGQSNMDESSKDYWHSAAAVARWNDPNQYFNPKIALPDISTQPKVMSRRMHQNKGTYNAAGPEPGTRQLFRLTSRAVGNNGAEVILQGTGVMVTSEAELFTN